MQAWLIVGLGIVYLASLFAVASYGDRLAKRGSWIGGRPMIYALTLGVYCTSWTFFGSVGLAATAGFDFLAIYIGAGVMIGLGYPLMLRMVRLAKAHNTTSVGDFIAARYGKNPKVAAVVALICVIGVTPYIALQLKAIAASLATIGAHLDVSTQLPVVIGETAPVFSDFALLVTLVMAAFALLFGTRHADATEHQHGLMLAIALESVVKLIAFLIVGVFVTFVLFSGPGALLEAARATPGALEGFEVDLGGGRWLTMITLSIACIVLLPRQFHVAIVENTSESEVRRAAWVFPLYLVAINIFVVPIALAGMVLIGPDADPDMFVLLVPMAADAHLVTLAAFIGGLSAATAMVIVSCVALGIMVCNDLVLPAVLRRPETGSAEMGRRILLIRRLSILAILALAYLYYRLTGETRALAEIGLLSFAAIAQLAPAFFLGLIWRRGTAAGAIAGMAGGSLVWTYTLLLPTFIEAGLLPSGILADGPFGLGLLAPQQLLNFTFEPLTHGVFWSLLINVTLYLVVSLARGPEPIERLQARAFVPSDFTPLPIPSAFRISRPTVRMGELETAVARYLGPEPTRSAFDRFATETGTAIDRRKAADGASLRFAEHLLASAIGTASSRLVLSLLLERRDLTPKAAAKLLDDASAAIQYNRDVLQSALDHVQQGIGVFDGALGMICVNDRFGALLDLPRDLVEFGVPLSDMLLHIARRGDFGPGSPDRLADAVVRDAVTDGASIQLHYREADRHIELRSSRMPDGGAVLTFTDVTDTVRAAEALARANETLENRVQRRTEELTRLNEELERARSAAEEANRDKTRFLAAASHDILQPLNAARLYVSSLVERKMRPEEQRIAANIDTSLEAVEDLLGAILDISRLDAGAMKPAYSVFRIEEELRHLEVEFRPLARDRGVDFAVVPSSLSVRSDRKLLRRLLQNLVSNAVKYTKSGRVLVGCRRRGDKVSIEVLDTGAGIPTHMQSLVFREFHRLERDRDTPGGLGLGLSIVQRITRVLDANLTLDSELDRGTRFAVAVPRAAALPSAATAPRRRVATGADCRNLVIACVDNEPQILDGMRALLGGWGARVVVATSAKSALKALRADSLAPDLLIVDYHLDRGNGLDAVRDLRWTLGQETPAVLITADRSQRLRDLASVRDIQVLHKPVKPAALRAMIGQLRKSNPESRQTQAPEAAE